MPSAQIGNEVTAKIAGKIIGHPETAQIVQTPSGQMPSVLNMTTLSNHLSFSLIVVPKVAFLDDFGTTIGIIRLSDEIIIV